MRKYLLAWACMLAVAAGAGAQGHNDGFKYRRSRVSVAAGAIADGKGESGFSYMMMSSNFIGDSPFSWGFNSTSGMLGKDLVSESGVQAGVGTGLLGKRLGADAFLGFDVGGRIDLDDKLYIPAAPAVLVGMALSFPNRADWDVALHGDAFVRPYDLRSSSWNFCGTYFALYVAIDLKKRLECRETKWSEGLKDS